MAGAVAVPDDTLSAIEKGQIPGNKAELQHLLGTESQNRLVWKRP